VSIPPAHTNKMYPHRPCLVDPSLYRHIFWTKYLYKCFESK